jgi:molybdate transport system substrate-binding protein
LNITWQLGALGALQQQIENGAPVDTFISAAKKANGCFRVKKF